MIRIAQPLIGAAERDAVLAVLDSGRLAAGPVTQALEQAFARDVAGTREAVAVSSGSAALHVALLAHNIGPGDEVITTPFSFQATANMILATGARPVFTDVGEDGNIDASLVEVAISPRTRAILPVHLYGRLCDVDALRTIAQRHGLTLIEDAAQAHAAAQRGQRAGSFGTGCFSFYATKNMTAGEGGIITTSDPSLAGRMRRIRSHGESERFESVELGFNYRLTELQAALALVQLGRLPETTSKRRRNAAYLSAHLSGVILPPAPVEPGAMVWHQYTIRVPRGAGGPGPTSRGRQAGRPSAPTFGPDLRPRDALAAWLRQRDIESAVYYPRALPDQPLYRDLGYESGSFSVTRRLAQEVLSLPVHPGLSQDDLDRIVEAINAWTTQQAQPLVKEAAS